MSYKPPTEVVDASWVGAAAYTTPINPHAAWWGTTDNGAGIRRLSPHGWGSYAVQPAKLFHGWEYVPPFRDLDGHWSGAAAYTSPDTVVSAGWVRAAGGAQYLVGVSADDTSTFGEPQVSNDRELPLDGWDSFAGGDALVEQVFLCDGSWLGAALYVPQGPVLVHGWWAGVLAGTVFPVGVRGWSFGTLSIVNKSAQVRPPSIDSALELGAATVWNWRQYANVGGLNANAFGVAYVQGGVKFVTPPGLQSFASGDHTVINTTANRTLVPAGIAQPIVLIGGVNYQIPPPMVSPRFLRPGGIYGTATGTPRVQFPPQPKGWLSSAFGYATVEYKTRVARPGGIDALAVGFPVVRDRATRLLHRSQITVEIFGDILLRQKNTRVRVDGIEPEPPGRWGEVRSTRRALLVPGAAHTEYGDALARNKTPALWPAGIMSQRIGAHGVGYSVRHVFPAGAIPPYPRTGHHSLWQTPSLGPASIPAPIVQPPTIWYGTRAVEPIGWLSQRIGEAWPAFRWRRVVAEGCGIDGHKSGDARLEHADRRIPPLGRDFLLFGAGWVSHGRRVVDLVAQGVEFPGMPNHRVGYTRQVAPFGFEATRWLKTIVPEAQDIYPKTFGAEYGWPRVEHYKRYLRLAGITTYPEPQMHWGTARVWNLRQIITQVEDQQSGLWPPAGTRWTLVENRNRLTRTSGWAATRYGNTHVELGARVILPAGIPAPALPGWQKVGMVSHRVRKLPLEGLEPPYVGHWGVIWNKAEPLHPRGFVATLFGQATLANTRRYRRIEGFTPDAYGYPLVAYRIRELTFEPRYGIHPPVIALPRVFHYTRYVEPPGIGEPKASVQHILESRFNRIVTKWSQQSDLFGWPALKNLTPELGTRGRAADEWGDAFVRLEWRPVAPEGTDMQLFGGLTIADRTRRIVVAGASHMTMGQLTAKRIGTDPVVTQYIDLRVFITDPTTFEQRESQDGYGIKIPEIQVPSPDLLKGYIFHGVPPGAHNDMVRLGKPTVHANTIRVEPGYWDLLVGEPSVGLKVRTLKAKTIGQLVMDSALESGDDMGDWGMPRLSPHTIYAVLEAPAQAMRNHKMSPEELRPVNAGVRIGHPSVTQYLGLLSPAGIDPNGTPLFCGVGRPEVISMRRAVAPYSFNALRVGWPVIPGTQHVTVEEPILAQPMPSPAVAFPPSPPVARPDGIAAPPFGRAVVDFYHRSVAAHGWLSQLMDGRSGTTPTQNDNMPQTLHVGPPNPHQQVGFDAAHYGNAWVSHRVREVAAHGHDSFVCDYELEQFAKRMRVRNADDRWPGRQIVAPAGHRSSAFGHAAARPARHYIRPDGNSNQHRKGAPAL